MKSTNQAPNGEMVHLGNVLIFWADRRVIKGDISEKLEISVGTAHKNVTDDLIFSKVNCRWVSQGQCKAFYCSKNGGNQHLIWLGTAAIFSLGSRFPPPTNT